MRRQFLKQIAVVPALAALSLVPDGIRLVAQSKPARTGGSKLKVGLNAYSFNEPLLKGGMKLGELLEFCAGQGLDAVDLTGYYFAGYPEPPSDDAIFAVKRQAFLLGIDISGTGVRNDFTYIDPKKRADDVIMVKKWIEVAGKLGAPVIRIFAGRQSTGGYTWDQVAGWMVENIRECVDHGKKHGVMIGIQNHNDFIKTPDDALKILQLVNSEWCGLILDTGSFRGADPYAEIAEAAPYAINWQIKESVYIGDNPSNVDLGKLAKIIRDSGYRGYLPIETLGAGDPKVKVPAFLKEVRAALER
ncbi:MAG TPA: sugar phosphate isomerase/epimerase [Bacteroidetes bacterium]|nr:MAG: xylose isomerase [Ignavibacteria bacterium GWA2_54_16]HCA81808.1 sugar phosphate isomerase/epimerase [Bacteroidota bacterium]